ncbi:hypothetical protein ACWCPG_37850, partial [Streptomyces sp. NPDC001919]
MTATTHRDPAAAPDGGAAETVPSSAAPDSGAAQTVPSSTAADGRAAQTVPSLEAPDSRAAESAPSSTAADGTAEQTVRSPDADGTADGRHPAPGAAVGVGDAGPRRRWWRRRGAAVTGCSVLLAVSVAGHGLLPGLPGRLSSLAETLLPWSALAVPVLVTAAGPRSPA